MSIYFYATNNAREIKALCGVKTLIIPYSIAEKIKSQLDNIAQEKLSTESLEEEFKQSLRKELQSRELEEEYNHFKCLVHSRAANFFHVRNIMLRYSYSSYTRNRITNKNIYSHSVFREVLRYFIDYAHFHYAAYPFIEGHHLLLSEKEDKKATEAILYPERIQKARKFLAENVENFKSKESSYRNVGFFVDRNFCLLLKLERETFAILEYFPIDEECLKQCNLFFWLSFMFGRLLTRPALWGYLAHVIMSRIKIIYPYILGRLFPGRLVKQNIGILPAILCKNITIDPVGFPYKKQYIKSPEKSYPSRLHHGLAHLFWHILSRCAVVASLLALDVPEGKVNNYFKKLRRFNGKWREKAEKAEWELAHIDTVIIEQLAEQHDKIPHLSPWKKIPYLETIAINIFKEYRGKNFFDFQDPNSPHDSAINCSYMHI